MPFQLLEIDENATLLELVPYMGIAFSKMVVFKMTQWEIIIYFVVHTQILAYFFQKYSVEITFTLNLVSN